MRWISLALFFTVAAAQAAETRERPLDQYQQWLSHVQGNSIAAAGPTGMYAAQDMKEVKPGKALYLPAAASREALRWSDEAAGDAVVRVEYKGEQVLVGGKGVESIDLMQQPGHQMSLPGGPLAVRITPLSKNAPPGTEALKVWLYNADLVDQRKFRGLDYYPYDEKAVVTATFKRNEKPVPVNYLDSREHAGLMYVIGTATMTVGGKPLVIKAFSYKSDWKDMEFLLLLFRDGTSGKGTYGGGRVVDVWFDKGRPPEKITVNFNMAYAFLCAHSSFYNCPLALAERVDASLPYGEKYPPL